MKYLILKYLSHFKNNKRTIDLNKDVNKTIKNIQTNRKMVNNKTGVE